jgi:hypothetical protein
LVERVNHSQAELHYQYNIPDVDKAIIVNICCQKVVLIEELSIKGMLHDWGLFCLPAYPPGQAQKSDPVRYNLPPPDNFQPASQEWFRRLDQYC